MKKLVIDLSAWQEGIDMQKVKYAGIYGVILKLGENCRETETFREQFQQAREAGLQIGAYYFAHGLNVADIEREGDWTVAKLKEIGLTDYHLPLSLWLDYELEECKDLTMQRNTNNICAYLNKVGTWLKNYGVYSSYDILWNYTYLFTQVNWLPTWCAQYSSECDYPNPKLWQFTDSFDCAGMQVDCSELYY